MKPVRNIRLTLAFDGTPYHGWQIQKNQVTIQGVVRSTIEKITGERVVLIGSGRTDAGTHARALVANFASSSRLAPRDLARALNSLLPHDIRVIGARRVPRNFHAQHAACSKTYRYQIYTGPVMPPHLARENYHYPYPLHVAAMVRTARIFAGAHDFASFSKTKRFESRAYPGQANSSGRGAAARDGDATTVRTVFRADLKRRGRRIWFTIEADGFLHHMVRSIVGTLLEVGRGRMTLDQVRALFRERDRTRAGFTVPAHGLILLKVRYKGSHMKSRDR